MSPTCSSNYIVSKNSTLATCTVFIHSTVHTYIYVITHLQKSAKPSSHPNLHWLFNSPFRIKIHFSKGVQPRVAYLFRQKLSHRTIKWNSKCQHKPNSKRIWRLSCLQYWSSSVTQFQQWMSPTTSPVNMKSFLLFLGLLKPWLQLARE